jgi:hypothetical protein
MICIVRAHAQWRACWPDDADIRIALVRRTPSIVAEGAGQYDLFCVGDEAALDRLRGQGWNVIALRDGWYADDGEGGVAIWGQGLYWEIRDTPFSVKEAVGPVDAASDAPTGEESQTLDVRRGIFGV